MQSLEWKHARKHQTNSSSSKATFAFGRDSRFKRDSLNLYLPSYPAAIPSTTSPPKWEKPPLLASAEAPKAKSSTPTSTPPRPRTTTSSPASSSARRAPSSDSADRYHPHYPENEVQRHIQQIVNALARSLQRQIWFRQEKRVHNILKTGPTNLLKFQKPRTRPLHFHRLPQQQRPLRDVPVDKLPRLQNKTRQTQRPQWKHPGTWTVQFCDRKSKCFRKIPDF